MLTYFLSLVLLYSVVRMETWESRGRRCLKNYPLSPRAVTQAREKPEAGLMIVLLSSSIPRNSSGKKNTSRPIQQCRRVRTTELPTKFPLACCDLGRAFMCCLLLGRPGEETTVRKSTAASSCRGNLRKPGAPRRACSLILLASPRMSAATVDTTHAS